VEFIKPLVEAVQSIGFPQVISLGLIAVLWQQTGVLKGIRSCLDQMHETLRDGACRYRDKVRDEPIHKAASSLRADKHFRVD
jgi:hypothetical protein